MNKNSNWNYNSNNNDKNNNKPVAPGGGILINNQNNNQNNNNNNKNNSNSNLNLNNNQNSRKQNEQTSKQQFQQIQLALKLPEFKVIFNPFIIDLIYSTILDNPSFDFFGFLYGVHKETTNFKTNDKDSSNKQKTKYIIIESVDFIFDKNSLNKDNLNKTIENSINTMSNASTNTNPDSQLRILGMFSTRNNSFPYPSIIENNLFFSFNSCSVINNIRLKESINKKKNNGDNRNSLLLNALDLPYLFGNFTTETSTEDNESNNYDINNKAENIEYNDNSDINSNNKANKFFSFKMNSLLYYINPNTQQDFKTVSYDMINLKETTYKYEPFVYGDSINIMNIISNNNSSTNSSDVNSEIKKNSEKVVSDLKSLINKLIDNIKKGQIEKKNSNNIDLDLDSLRKELIQRKLKYENLTNELIDKMKN